jgi:NitT/TauT family transport system ATP-binding protein
MGDVVVHGRRVQRRPSSSIGYLFQSDTLLPWLTVARNVSLPSRFNGIPYTSGSISALLDSVGLTGFDKRFPRELSGGMRKRVQIAQVLAQDPAVILMDEPFGSLDAQTRVLLQGQFLSIWERSAKTVLLVTHDLNEAILLSDRIICMSARPGRVLLDIEVPIPRPRVLSDVMRGSEYVKIYDLLWSTLEAEANAAMAGTDQ